MNQSGAHRLAGLLVVTTLAWGMPAAGVDLLEQVQVLRDGSGGVNGLDGPAHIAVSADGKHVYSTGIFDNGVAAFSRDAATGVLTFVEAEIDGVSGASGLQRAFGIAIAPDGNHVYVGGQQGTLAVFSRNSSTGHLTYESSYFDNFGGVDGIGGANSVAVSPDNKHVYVGGGADNAIAVFSRNIASGLLTFVESQDDDLGDNGVRGIFWVTVSADGKNVYGAGSFDDAIGVFSRNESTGRLTPIQQLRGEGLDGVSSVKVSADLRHVYTAATEDDAVGVFRRNLSDGQLTLVEVESDRFNGIDGILGAFSVDVSPDGAHVYAATVDDSAVVAFARNSDSGEIEFLQVLRDGRNGNDGLLGACSVITAPGSNHVYCVGFNEDAVSGFAKQALGSVRGVVSDDVDDTGIACGVIELVDGGTVVTAVTDANGGYALVGLVPGSYTVRVLGVGYGTATPGAVVVGAGDSLVRDYGLSRRTASGGISGRVTDDGTGEPLAGVYIEARIMGSFVASTYSCATGEFEFDGLVQKGGTSVQLTYMSENYVSASVNVSVSPSQVTPVTQTLVKAVGTTASLSGVVSGGAGGISGATVTIRGAFNGTRTTDSNGMYSFNDVISGNYSIRASAMDFEGQTANWGVEDGRAVTKNFVLRPLGALGEGDLDGDGNVNSVDVQLVINVVLGTNTSTNGDVDGSGQTNSIDIQLVINAVLGI